MRSFLLLRELHIGLVATTQCLVGDHFIHPLFLLLGKHTREELGSVFIEGKIEMEVAPIVDKLRNALAVDLMLRSRCKDLQHLPMRGDKGVVKIGPA